ncbi:hypothetical protein IS481_09220 [Caldimonas thermodepolymerans]|nr:hypothetical protein [Caldimonas thermodepolymerans]QPC30001.1 hypothetical protein IS481_09220 [Caldimonas thermodepolymerans]UZG42746.1 hypothetical protein ONZ46_09880 [Caldimonas thermodepolymerans]UZG46417.1 hypothetical protein ONS87_10570 [Caldimonas thermodepolymerans]
MKPSSVDTLAWVAIFGGLLVLCLGVFVARQAQGLGHGFLAVGALATVVGAVLIYVRSRMADVPGSPQ